MLGDTLGKTQPVQARGCENDGIELAFVELAQARVDVAANRLKSQVGAGGANLRLAAQAARADERIVRQITKTLNAGVRHQRVAHVFAFADGADVQAGGKLGRQIFQAVNREVDAALVDGFFEFFGEQALALLAELGQRDVEHAVAFGRDDFDLDLQAGMQALELALHPVSLPQRQLAAARSDDEGLAQGSPSDVAQAVSLRVMMCKLTACATNKPS